MDLMFVWKSAHQRKNPSECWDFYVGAQSGNRTRTTFGQGILSPSRLPIPPSAHNPDCQIVLRLFRHIKCSLAHLRNNFLISNTHGGTYGSRTRLRGFADRCVTAPPTRRPIHYNRYRRSTIKIAPIDLTIPDNPCKQRRSLLYFDSTFIPMHWWRNW